jgi:hypothetical protein
MGAWGDSSTPEQRGAVSLKYGIGDGASGFAIVDGADRSITNSKLVGRSFTRAEVINTPLAGQVFAIADAVFMTDPRLDEVRTWK